MHAFSDNMTGRCFCTGYRADNRGLHTTALILAILLLLLPPTVNATGEPRLSQWTATRLNKVNELLAEEKYNAARERLRELLESLSGDTYESAMTQQALAYSYALENNYHQAIPHFEAALKGLAKSPPQLQKTRFDLAQLYMAEEQYDKAIPLLREWIRQERDAPTALAHILLSNAYYRKAQPEAAIVHAETAIRESTDAKEAWYRLLLSLYLDTDQMAPARDLLTTMIQRFPQTAIYWKQLGNVQLQLKAFKAGTAAMEIAWQRGLLHKESELLNLARLLLHIEHPDKAARLLESEIAAQRISKNLKNWRLLGSAWLQAREQEKAIQAFTRAAPLSDNGNLYLQVAQLHIDRNEWQQGREALEKALAAGGLKQPGNAYLLLGIARMELEDTDKAVKAFEQAAQFSETSKSANQWLRFISS